ncbi:MAG: hypothetical protein IJ452_08860 [Butyricicoccus sp.]|nr:hypothetical protein [Butyricicoccus sp.]MBQ8586374.1 hypothetical protein [Butyricicoccus sp.]
MKKSNSSESHRVNIYMSAADYAEFLAFVASTRMSQSDAACYLMKRGMTLRLSVRSDILRDIAPSLTAFSDISSDLLVLWCQHGTELTPIIGSDTYCRFRDRIADAISDLTAAILAA